VKLRKRERERERERETERKRQRETISFFCYNQWYSFNENGKKSWTINLPLTEL